MLDIQKIVLGGSLAVVAEAMMPATRAVLHRDVLAATRLGLGLEVSLLGQLAVPMGGVALAMEGFLSLPTWLAVGEIAALHTTASAHSGVR